MADWRDDPELHEWSECCCERAGDGHCWQCGKAKDEHRAATEQETGE